MIRISTPYKFISLVFAFAFLFIIQQVLSNKGGAPIGGTGAPGETNCTSCHAGTAVSNSSSILVFTNMTNGQYIPDSTYQIKIRAIKTSCVRFGFSTTMLDSNTSPSRLGTLEVPSGSTTIQVSSFTRDYATHTLAGSSALYTDSTEWILNWKAPSSLSGDAKLYVAVCATNNNGDTSGDQTYLKTFTFPQNTNVPVASINTGINTICQSDSIYFQGSGTNNTTSYEWTFPGGTPATSTAQNVWVKFTSGSKLCSLRVANNIMYSAYTTKTITVNSNPSAGINYNSNAFLCDGDSLPLSTFFNASLSYQWLKDGNNISGAIGYRYYAKASGSYQVIVTNSNGCSVVTSAALLNFNSRPLAVLTTQNATINCQGDTVLLKTTSGSNYSYYWYKDNALLTQTLDSTLSVYQSGNYSVRIYSVTGCNMLSNIVSLIFGNLPSGSITSSTDSICYKDIVRLNALTTDTIASYQWYRDSVLIPGAIAQDYFTGTAGSYTVELITNRGCRATLPAKQIKVNPLPPANFIDSTRNGCSYLLNIRNTGNYTYQWMRNGTIFNSTDTVVTVTQTGVYTVNVLNASGCAITTNALSVYIPDAPNPTLSPPTDAIICSDSSLTLAVPPATGTSFTWFKNGILLISGSQNSISVNDSGNYYVVVDNGLCTAISPIRNVKVNPAPIAFATCSDTTFCTGDSTSLTTNNLIGLTYEWFKNNLPLVNSNSSTYYATSSGLYSVKVTLGPCSKISNTINVIEKQLPSIPLITRNINLLTSSAASTYQWFKNGLPINGATSQTYTVTVTGDYMVQVTNSAGCKNVSATLTVIPVGINQANLNPIIKAYPNPVNHNLFLTFADFGLHEITIMDASGRLLKSFSETGSKTVIDFRELESGVYFVKVSSDINSQIIRVVKK